MSASLLFAPMSLAVLNEPFDHDDFIFELKYDGFRALAHVDSGRCRLISRNHHEFTTFPETRSFSAVCLELRRTKSLWRGKLLRGLASLLETRKHTGLRSASFESVL